MTSWTIELPNSLTKTDSMFWGCSGLNSWNGNVALPNSLTDTSNMFWGCSGLNSWNVALPNSIRYANGMFSGCSNLTSFASDMPSSLSSDAYEMFSGCKLDIESVERISRTIAVCTGSGEGVIIHLGVSTECHEDSNYNTYIDRMIDKGWIVVCDVNGSEHTHPHS